MLGNCLNCCFLKRQTLNFFANSENEKSENEEGFKLPVQALPSNVRFFARLNSTGKKNSETCT